MALDLFFSMPFDSLFVGGAISKNNLSTRNKKETVFIFTIVREFQYCMRLLRLEPSLVGTDDLPHVPWPGDCNS